MPRSSSAGRWTEEATGVQARPTARLAPCRSLPSWPFILARHRRESDDTSSEAPVFATRTGRPLGQRNVARALRAAQTHARDENGRPTFPILHERDPQERLVAVPRGAAPSMDSFRHTVASRALLAGESVDEVAFLLGHRDGNVTRTVYVREIAHARRRAMRRSRMNAEFAGVLEAAEVASASRGGRRSRAAERLYRARARPMSCRYPVKHD